MQFRVLWSDCVLCSRDYPENLPRENEQCILYISQLRACSCSCFLFHFLSILFSLILSLSLPSSISFSPSSFLFLFLPLLSLSFNLLIYFPVLLFKLLSGSLALHLFSIVLPCSPLISLSLSLSLLLSLVLSWSLFLYLPLFICLPSFSQILPYICPGPTLQGKALARVLLPLQQVQDQPGGQAVWVQGRPYLLRALLWCTICLSLWWLWGCLQSRWGKPWLSCSVTWWLQAWIRYKYKTRQWHKKYFTCCTCTNPIW